MTNQNGNPGGGWLPVLDAGQRFRPQTTSTETSERAAPVEATAPAAAAKTGLEETIKMEHRPTTTPITGIDWSAELESQFGITSAPASEHETQAAASSDTETIAELRDRLAYYEHFDSLIRDNIARSAELFQAVFAEREKVRGERRVVESDVLSMTAEIERRMNTERSHTQQMLLSLMEEATYLQQRADSLIQRIAEAITEASVRPDEDDEPVAGA